MGRSWRLRLGAACLAGSMILTTPIYSKAAGGVDVNTTFPDAAFRSYVSDKIDKDHNGELSSDEIDKVTKIQVFDMGIADLSGIDTFPKLRELDCGNNELTSLNLSGNGNLLFLSCENNQLTTLDLSGNAEIIGIDCHNNKLKNLYLPVKDEFSREAGNPSIYTKGNPDLRVIDMRRCDMRSGGYGTQSHDNSTIAIKSDDELGFCKVDGKRIHITDTGVSPATVRVDTGWINEDGKLYYAGEDGFILTGKQTIGGTVYYFDPDGVLQEDVDWGNVAAMVDEATFPDEKFRNYVWKKIDKDHNALLSQEEIDKVTALSIYSRKIKDLKGIEVFDKLERLDCSYNRLTSLDLSKNTALQYVDCHSNKLTELNLGKNTALTCLECENNSLKALNVSGLSNLQMLYCHNNELTSLDISKNTALDSLDCSGNKLSGLSLTPNTALTYLRCEDDQLTTLDLSQNTALQQLNCSNNPLTKLDLCKLKSLERLGCSDDRLTALDISKNTALYELECDGNQMTKLDVSNNKALYRLSCAGNQLQSLDVSKNTQLKYLDCRYNQMTSLNIVGASSLSNLYCSGNALSRLNLYQIQNLVDAYQKGDKGTWSSWVHDYSRYIKVVSFDFYEEIYHEDEYDSWWEERCGYLEIDPALESKIINGVTGWVKKDGKTYYYDEDAKLVKGLKKIGTSTYCFDTTTGERKVGWQTVNKKKYYFDPNKYTMKTGWQTINKKKYYFDTTTGEMKTGWQTINKKKYYVDTTTGEMKTGIQTISKKKYYLDPKTGEMKTGIQTVNKKKYYFDPKTGEMKTGWQTVSSKKYYFDPKTGEMKTGIQTINKKSYYFDPKTGEMKTGWQTVSKKKYYFKANGVMAKNEYIKGIYLNKKGVRSNKAKCTWRKYKKGKKYGNAKGWFAKGVTLTIDGKKYTFKKNGYVK